jgi:hypothetical protein
MEEREERWAFRDLLLSFGIATDPVLLGVGYAGLMVAGSVYGFFFFLGSAFGGQGARNTFSVVGGVGFIVLLLLTAGVLARIVVVRILEGRRSTTEEIRDYVTRRAWTLLAIPACFAGIVLAALGGVGTLEVIGRLPGLGPIIFGATFTLAFLLSLAAVVAFILHTLGGLLYPAMLATRTEGAMAAVGELLKLARQKGAHLLVYSLAILAAGTLSTLVIASVVSLALAITASSAHSLMGEKFGWILSGLPSFFRPYLDVFGAAVGPVATADVPWHFDLGGILVGLSLLSIFAATLAYPFVLIHSAGTLAYFALTDEPLPEKAPEVLEPEEEPDAEEDWVAAAGFDPGEYEP